MQAQELPVEQIKKAAAAPEYAAMLKSLQQAAPVNKIQSTSTPAASQSQQQQQVEQEEQEEPIEPVASATSKPHIPLAPATRKGTPISQYVAVNCGLQASWMKEGLVLWGA